MEPACSSKILVPVYQSIKGKILEESDILSISQSELQISQLKETFKLKLRKWEVKCILELQLLNYVQDVFLNTFNSRSFQVLEMFSKIL
jgi:hypothetical protein